EIVAELGFVIARGGEKAVFHCGESGIGFANARMLDADLPGIAFGFRADSAELTSIEQRMFDAVGDEDFADAVGSESGSDTVESDLLSVGQTDFARSQFDFTPVHQTAHFLESGGIWRSVGGVNAPEWLDGWIECTVCETRPLEGTADDGHGIRVRLFANAFAVQLAKLTVR